MKTVSTAVVLILACISSTAAQDKSPKDNPAAAAQLKFADADADGKLTLVELRKARSAYLKACIEARAQKDVERAKRMKDEYRDLMSVQDFLAADTDNDRLLTVEQLTAFIALVSENRRWRLSDLDIETVAQEKWGENWEWSIAGVDLDGDERISKSEGGDDLKDDKNQKEFDAADLDGDGTLSRYEYMKVGIERFKQAAKPRVAKAREEFGDTVCGEPANSNNLYQRRLRQWTFKIYIKNEDGEFTDYRNEEVIDVKAESATLRTIDLDKNKKPRAGEEKGKETEIEFLNTANSGKLSEYVDGGMMLAAGREWRVEVTEYEFAEMKIKSWRSAEMPRLVVRAEVHWGAGEKAGERIVTLEEFSDGE